MSLVARHLEAHGIPTVILGSAIDIVEHCRVPRFFFTDFPLGNPCGKPDDKNMQVDIVRQAVSLLERATGAETIERAAYSWDSQAWRQRYMLVNDENRAQLMAAGDALRARRARMRAEGRVRES